MKISFSQLKIKNVHVYHLFVIKFLQKKTDFKIHEKRKLFLNIIYNSQSYKPYLKYGNSDLKNTKNYLKK